MFNTNRFLQFGKYDLAINKVFYRNMSLITIFGCIGIATIGFILRWNMCGDFYNTTSSGISYLSGSYNPEFTSVTAMFIIGFCSLMMFIFAGFTFHNLRNKQGRISELTIPASNIESWSWHILLSMGGGLVLCLVSIVSADIVNAILNLIAYLGKCNSSLTVELFRNLFLIPNECDDVQFTMNGVFKSLNNDGAGYLIRLFITCVVFCQISFYIFGNAVKYKYNIILTYIATQVLGSVIMVISILTVTYLEKQHIWGDIMYNIVNSETISAMIFYGICTVNVLLGALFLWGSYKMYCKAQITSPLNK